MGQQQLKNEGKGTDGTGSPHKHNDLRDRVSANFKGRTTPVVNPASGTGSKGNPGKPV